MEQVKLAQVPTDELDISALFRQAFSFFSHYGKLLLVVALVGTLGGFARYWKTPNLYTSSLVLQPTILSDPEQMALINNWSALLKKKELPVLANQFNIDVSLLKKVESITTEELQKSFATNNFTAFSLTVLVRDTAILQPLQKGMTHALNNSEYVKDKLVSQKNRLTSMVQILDKEINRLNNLQTAVETSLKDNNNAGGRLLLNVSDISEQIASLQLKKLTYEEELTFLSAVHVLQNFYTHSNPTYPVLIKQLILGLCGGLFLGILISFYLHYRRKILN